MVKNAFSLNASLTSLRQDLMLPGTLTSSRNKSSWSLSEEEYLQLEQLKMSYSVLFRVAGPIMWFIMSIHDVNTFS